MFRGIYGSVSAMLVQEKAVDVASNNLANSNTSGFSKSRVIAKTFPEVELVKERRAQAPASKETSLGSTSLGVVLAETAVDNSPGVVRETGNPLDCAIQGEGFFQVSDGAEMFYTRSGNFKMDDQGQIVNSSGLVLAGENGPLVAGEAESVEIQEDGSVIADGEQIGMVPVFRFENPSFLHRRGSSILSETPSSGAPQLVPAGEARLIPEALEGSNVVVVEEMTRMIEANRAYEAASKAFEAGSEAGRKMIETFGS